MRSSLLVSKLILFAAVGVGFAGCSLPRDVLFQSEESHTIDDKPVFNQVRFLASGARDVWMMNQSHDQGLSWDRLAIVVSGGHASFYQLEPGVLEWSEGLKQTEFRVSCALCHANGPRAVRPEPGTFGSLTGIRDLDSAAAWMRVALWNLKVKRYPHLVSDAAKGFAHTIPFRFSGKFANSPLKVATCVFCHREDGPIGRGTLVRQNALAISKMVENGNMPPLGIPLVASQRAELARFLKGF